MQFALHLGFASVKVDLGESSQVDAHVTEVGACRVIGASLRVNKLLSIGVVVVHAECPVRLGQQHRVSPSSVGLQVPVTAHFSKAEFGLVLLLFVIRSCAFR